MTVRRRLYLPLPLLLVAGFLLPFDGSDVAPPERPTDPGEIAYRELPALPVGTSERGRAGVEASAIELAAALRAVPVAENGDACDPGRLRVLWEAPGSQYRHGAVVPPVGPAPDAATEEVNGAVVCEGVEYGYMGFEATWTDDGWDVVAVPFIDESDEHLAVQPNPAPAPAGTVTPSLDRAFSGGIEGYAAYEPQRTCDPTPKSGTVSLQRMLLNGNPGSRNLGISRGCSIGGQSEHKEGRAFDWGVYVTNAKERAQADGFVAALMATDAEGNRHALARRMGVMYVIWNRKIWSSYRAGDGWRPYSGASPHTDHIHISLAWAGALGRTSFWSGTVPADLVAMPSSATVPAASRRPGSASGGSQPSRSRHTVTTEARRRWEAMPEAEREELERKWREQRAAERQRREELRERYEEERERREEAWRERRSRDRDDAGEQETTTTTEARRRAWQERIEAERERIEDQQRERRRRWSPPTTDAPAPTPTTEAPTRERRRRWTPPTTVAPAPTPTTEAPTRDRRRRWSPPPAPSTETPTTEAPTRDRRRRRWSPPTTVAPTTTTVAPTTTTAAPTTTAPPPPPPTTEAPPPTEAAE